MAIKIKSVMVALLIGLMLTPSLLFGCGPFIPAVNFTYSDQPEPPRVNYARGELGVVQPTFARSYLTVAYRYFTGLGLNEQEQNAFIDLWKERKGEGVDQYAIEQDWVKTWLEARNKIAKTAPIENIDLYKSVPEYSYILNCNGDSFRTAAETLDKRVKQFGANSVEVKEWLAGQDKVFTNCSGEAAIPEPAPDNINTVIKDDRAYQIAAAYFYATRYDDAYSRFEQIAKDKRSPWSTVAPLVMARTLVRKGTVGAGEGKIDLALLGQADNQLKKVLSDQSLAPIHASAKRLSAYVSLRLSPEQRLRELAGEIVKKDAQQNLRQHLIDFIYLMDNLELDEKAQFTKLKLPPNLAGRNPDAKDREDLIEWIQVFQRGETDEEALTYSLAAWDKTASLPWLISAITKMKAGHARQKDLLAAALKIDKGSPAYATVKYHRIRLLLEGGNTKDARVELDEALTAKNLPNSARNLFLAQRLPLSRSLNELLENAQRFPAGVSTGEGGDESSIDAIKTIYPEYKLGDNPRLLDSDGAAVLNQKLPITMLRQALDYKDLAENLRKELTLAVWTRAVLLDNEDISKELAPAVVRYYPALKAFMGEYQKQTDPAARKFAVIFLMLKAPGVRPVVDTNISRQTPIIELDSFRDNWWCLFEPSAAETQFPTAKVVEPVFLDKAQSARAKAEQAKLLQLGTAPNYFSQQVVEWGKLHPEDERVAEALHLVVRATRFGCKDDDTLKHSKAAFQLLHKQYPKSDWAKKTPYFYGNN